MNKNLTLPLASFGVLAFLFLIGSASPDWFNSSSASQEAAAIKVFHQASEFEDFVDATDQVRLSSGKEAGLPVDEPTPVIAAHKYYKTHVDGECFAKRLTWVYPPGEIHNGHWAVTKTIPCEDAPDHWFDVELDNKEEFAVFGLEEELVGYLRNSSGYSRYHTEWAPEVEYHSMADQVRRSDFNPEVDLLPMAEELLNQSGAGGDIEITQACLGYDDCVETLLDCYPMPPHVFASANYFGVTYGACGTTANLSGEDAYVDQNINISGFVPGPVGGGPDPSVAMSSVDETHYINGDCFTRRRVWSVDAQFVWWLEEQGFSEDPNTPGHYLSQSIPCGKVASEDAYVDQNINISGFVPGPVGGSSTGQISEEYEYNYETQKSSGLFGNLLNFGFLKRQYEVTCKQLDWPHAKFTTNMDGDLSNGAGVFNVHSFSGEMTANCEVVRSR